MKDGGSVLPASAASSPLLAQANDDPPVAAIGAVYNSAIAHGDDRDHFLSGADIALN